MCDFQFMQVTFAFNHFGRGLIQRMPRCRHGYFHVVNNDFTEWKMYAIGGSADPTINSQGNRYIAPPEADAKEVIFRLTICKRVIISFSATFQLISQFVVHGFRILHNLGCLFLDI